MIETMVQLTLEVLSAGEIACFRQEMERIQEKHTTAHEPCNFEIIEGEVDLTGSSLISLSVNKAMLEAYFVEQIT